MSRKDEKPKGRNIINNGEMFSGSELESISFNMGDKFFLQADDYVGDFTVVDEREEQGSIFRQITGTAGNVIVLLSYLQREMAKGNIRMLSKGNKEDEE